VLTLLTFGGAFAIGRLTRHRRTPKWLSWIGVLSYSVYLIHYLLIQLGHELLASDAVPDPLIAATYLTAVLGLSWLTHRYVERPAQRLGRPRSVPRRPAHDRMDEASPGGTKETAWHG